MQIPDNLKYTEDHEWLESLDSGIYKIGITDYAQDALGDVVFVEIKELGTEVKAGETFGEAESTKSVSDLYAPISGTINASNKRLADEPELVNSDPYGEGWMCEIKAAVANITMEGEVKLLSPEEYKELVSR